MNVSTIGAIGLAALLTGGCESMNGPQAVANADAQRNTECKTVRISSGTEEIRRNGLRAENGTQTEPEDTMKEAEGRMAIGRVKRDEPRALRDDVAPLESLTSKALREC
ncbi:MAG TPA: hypothetical protein VKU81_05605 [Casimicrobiaceae bacterium]|nr:hypothetical protein [Casimicrobiaceae bacterium]